MRYHKVDTTAYKSCPLSNVMFTVCVCVCAHVCARMCVCVCGVCSLSINPNTQQNPISGLQCKSRAMNVCLCSVPLPMFVVEGVCGGS